MALTLIGIHLRVPLPDEIDMLALSHPPAVRRADSSLLRRVFDAARTGAPTWFKLAQPVNADHNRASSASYSACVPMKNHTIDSPWRWPMAR
jgi:hypothetical protein